MTNTLFWYSQPIKAIQCGKDIIQFCKWGDGIRLYSVNGIGYTNLSNSDFTQWLEFISNLEGV